MEMQIAGIPWIPWRWKVMLQGSLQDGNIGSGTAVGMGQNCAGFPQESSSI